MPNREKLDAVIHTWMRYLGTNYGAKVTAANSARAATLIGYAAESFNIASDGATVIVVEGTSNTVSLTQGTRTAAQIATDINNASIGATASDDGEGRVKIVSDTAPSSGAPSSLKIGEPSSGTDESRTLGFFPGQVDLREAIKDPGPRGFVYGPRQDREIPELEFSGLWRAVPNVLRQMDEIEVTITVYDRAPSAAMGGSFNLIQGHMSILDDLINDDRTAEGNFVFTELDEWQPSPEVWTIREDAGAVITGFAKGSAKARIRTYQQA